MNVNPAGRSAKRELPKTTAQFDLLESRDRTCLDTQPEW